MYSWKYIERTTPYDFFVTIILIAVGKGRILFFTSLVNIPLEKKM